MKKVNELDRLQKEALIETYNHYGIENINFQEANKIADKFIKSKSESLKNDAIKLDNEMSSINKNKIAELKNKLGKAPQGFTFMMNESGQIEEVPNNKVNEAIKQFNYEII